MSNIILSAISLAQGHLALCDKNNDIIVFFSFKDDKTNIYLSHYIYFCEFGEFWGFFYKDNKPNKIIGYKGSLMAFNFYLS